MQIKRIVRADHEQPAPAARRNCRHDDCRPGPAPERCSPAAPACRDALQKAEIPGSLNAGGDDDQQIRIGSRDGEGVYPAGGTTIRFPSRGRDPLSGVIRWQLSAPPVTLLSAYILRGHQRAAGSSSPASSSTRWRPRSAGSPPTWRGYSPRMPAQWPVPSPAANVRRTLREAITRRPLGTRITG